MPFNSIFAWLIKKRLHQIELFCKYPHEVQFELFDKLIDSAKNTEWGKLYNYDQIKNYEDFKNSVPLQEYDDIKPWVEKAIDGGTDILWKGETKWFAKSSGTTSDKSKLIPVTKDSLEGCHYKGGKDLLAMYYDTHENRKLYKGKHLIIGGSAQINELADDSYFGDLSAIIVKNLPWWCEIRRTPSKDITLMSDWEEKLDKMARSTMKQDVYILAGVPSWSMVLINRILEISGKDNIKEVWPNLELFMHGGVSFEPYRKEFEKLIPDPNMNYVETYNASEGFFGIQDTKANELLLMLDYGTFFEFIPMDKFDGVNSKHAISIKDVELDKNYALVISTNGGLWRYIIGDTIKFTNKAPYRFKISGRTKHYINAFGEEIIVDNADFAISKACERTGSVIRDYTACPVYMQDKTQGKHQWLIEFVKEPESFSHFQEVLDNALKSINSDYEAKRTNNLTLDFPLIQQLKKGSFDTWLKSKGKLGGQFKVPRLSNNRNVVDEILALENGTLVVN